MSSLRVAIVGGGVVGLCCAFELQRRGADVLVLERDQCGHGASWGNAGWIVPALSAPLATPGALRRALLSMRQPSSPVRVKARADLELLRWTRYFAQCSTRRRHASGLTARLLLGANAVAQFDALASAGVEFEMHRQGLLVLALTESSLEAAHSELAQVAESGYRGAITPLTGARVRSFEPAVSNGVVGGIFLENERYLRPETLIRGLQSFLLEHGAEIREQTAVHELEKATRRWRVRTSTDTHHADRVILAAGSWTAHLLRPLGFRLPLQPARGCSVTATGRGAAPRRALKLLDGRVACTPFDGAVRLSGTFDLHGPDRTLDKARLQTVIQSARPYFRDWSPEDSELQWSGSRAVSPDDLPFIGSLPNHDELFVATGHGTLGVTLAPATASFLAPIVIDGQPSTSLDAFRPDRFGL